MTAGLQRIGQRSPLLGDGRPDRRHRHLRPSAGDARGEDRCPLPLTATPGNGQVHNLSPRLRHEDVGAHEQETRRMEEKSCKSH